MTRTWPLYRCQCAARRKPCFLRQRAAVDKRPQRVQRLRVLLQQLLARIEQRQLQEALGSVALNARSECALHALAWMLRVEEQHIDERWDQDIASEQHGLVIICRQKNGYSSHAQWSRLWRRLRLPEMQRCTSGRR